MKWPTVRRTGATTGLILAVADLEENFGKPLKSTLDNDTDFPKAIHWYCLAVARGDARATNNLALLFDNGRGIPQDHDEASRRWRQSAVRGDLNAEASVGVQLATNATLSQDERHAGIERLRDAAHHGDKFAQDLLRQNGDTETFPPATFSARADHAA
jgi:TPR repeat protein